MLFILIGVKYAMAPLPPMTENDPARRQTGALEPKHRIGPAQSWRALCFFVLGTGTLILGFFDVWEPAAG
ncbi:hypothetical protein [Mesorhizobium sanjuanii]|uniref:hypothetical protein n=1 Tax=Mesorhizobium sanjuanii TaxID=2037900 RepID=UPI001AD81485|nr:hypothetical protein [Mesorhizobium sanjuanii]